jgi:hypothetical protein
MKTLMLVVRVGSLFACLVTLVTTSVGCENRERVVVRERPVVVRERPAVVYVRPQPVVQERVVIH